MKHVELEDPTQTFADFVEDRGKIEIGRCYFTPMERMQDERLWEFFDDEGNRVAWGGLRHVEPGLYGYRLGVFRRYERRGHRTAICNWLAATAFEDPAAMALRTSCQIGNPPQVVRLLNRHLKGNWLEMTGATLEPRPTIWFKLTRERWVKLQANGLGVS